MTAETMLHWITGGNDYDGELQGVPEVWARLTELAATDDKVAAFLMTFGPWAEEWTRSRLNS